MTYRVQFLDEAGSVIAESHAVAHSASGAIKLTGGLDWPEHAALLRILDPAGNVIHGMPRGG